MSGKLLGDLASIETESGISATTRAPFCIVRAINVAGDTFYGQVPPAVLREMALAFLATADAAESVAAIYEQFDELGMPEEAVASFIAGLRARRAP